MTTVTVDRGPRSFPAVVGARPHPVQRRERGATRLSLFPRKFDGRYAQPKGSRSVVEPLVPDGHHEVGVVDGKGAGEVDRVGPSQRVLTGQLPSMG